MIRLAAATTLVALLLLLTRSCQHENSVATTPAVQTTSTTTISPVQTGRQFVTALLSGDQLSAEALSTPLLAQNLVAEPASRTATAKPPVEIDLTPLMQDAGSADLAVELHWPAGKIAALRLTLVQLDGRWLVAEVGS